MKVKESDLWETPQDLFDSLNAEFLFNIDLSADNHNYKCRRWCQDIFSFEPDGHTTSGFMNPPYSNPYPFVEKALEISEKMLVVCLLKVDPSTKWWALFWDYENHLPKHGVKVRFIQKRLKFERKGVPGKTANFPSCLVIMDRRPMEKIATYPVMFDNDLGIKVGEVTLYG